MALSTRPPPSLGGGSDDPGKDSPMKTLLIMTLLAFTCFAQTSPDAQPQKLDASAVYAKVLPSVVVIEVARSGDAFGLGSGVIVSADGLIATNHHIIKDAIGARVNIRNGDIFEDVTIVDYDERKDMALIKIKGANLPAATLANSDEIKIGAVVHVIGAPRGLEGTLSSGIISGIRRAEEISPDYSGFRLLQFTAPISPGNSGGPILDEAGRLIGIVCAYKPDGQNLNFGVPANYLAGMMNSAKGDGRALGKMPDKSKDASLRTAAVKRSPAEIITSAKTLCIWQTSGNPAMKVEINAKLFKWGKLTLVSNPEEADLVFEVVQTGNLEYYSPGSAASGAALLREPRSGIELWSVRKGGYWAMSGYSISKVARQIGDALIEFLESKGQTQKRKK